MLSPDQFKSDILQVLRSRFAAAPNSLADAFSVIWAVDSYAVHRARYIEMPETRFKNWVQEEGGWQFRIIREASSAAKHAVCSSEQNRDVGRSSHVHLSEDIIVGWAEYFSNPVFKGPQICVQLSWSFNESTREWRDAKNNLVIGGGPFFSLVPLLDLVEPAVSAIEEAARRS